MVAVAAVEVHPEEVVVVVEVAALAIEVDGAAAVVVVAVLPEVDEALLEDEVLPEEAVEVLEALRVVRRSSLNPTATLVSSSLAAVKKISSSPRT